MSYEISWLPNVCQCHIMQDREDPSNKFEFVFKCPEHADMTDNQARLHIVAKCIEQSENVEAESGNNP